MLANNETDAIDELPLYIQTYRTAPAGQIISCLLSEAPRKHLWRFKPARCSNRRHTCNLSPETLPWRQCITRETRGREPVGASVRHGVAIRKPNQSVYNYIISENRCFEWLLLVRTHNNYYYHYYYSS